MSITGTLSPMNGATGFGVNWGGNSFPHQIDVRKFVDGPQKPVNVYEEIKKAVEKIKEQQQMKKLHLVTAVIKTIDIFHATKAEFSAFDVTKAIRAKVSSGEYDVTDVRQDDFGGRIMAVIAHNAIRDIVDELFDLDMIPDYKGFPFFDSVVGKSYKKYSIQPSAITPAPYQPSPVLASVPAVAPVTTAPNVLKQPDANMWALIDTYLGKRQSLSTTAKEIQSRLKGYKVTCEEIFNHYNNAGRTVFRFGTNYSKFQY